MGKRNGRQKGAPTHAEGQHGEKTQHAFIEGLHGSEESEGPATSNDFTEDGRPKPGRHRLQEDREQHDEAERNSEAPKIDGLGG